MPIPVKDLFEEKTDLYKTELEKVREFLKKHKDKAFTIDELQKELGITHRHFFDTSGIFRRWYIDWKYRNGIKYYYINKDPLPVGYLIVFMWAFVLCLTVAIILSKGGLT